ncbi:MAG: hypothetical protein VX642_11525 [Bdellovibrionota bacterium]|nr:hypothetical protein [Bdellovibrionota bacterium]
MFSKILQSKWFISISLLVIAIYLFSLVVIKKQGQIAGEELLVIKNFAENLANQKEEVDKLNSIFDKASLVKKNSFSLPNSNVLVAEDISAITENNLADYFANYREFIDDEEWQLFLNMESKTWYDLQMAKPVEFDKKYSPSSVIRNLLEEIDLLVEGKAKEGFLEKWELFLSYYYSQLVHLQEPLERKRLFEQSYLGLMAIFAKMEDSNRNYAILFVYNSNRLQEELINSQMAANSQLLMNEKDRNTFNGIEFLSKIAPLIPDNLFSQYRFIKKSPRWFCSYIRRHRRLLAYLQLSGEEFPLLSEQELIENKQQFVQREEICGDQLEEAQRQNFLENFKLSLKLPQRNGAWDLGNKYKAEGIAMKQLIVELSILYRRHAKDSP